MESSGYSLEQILDILPHRHPFLFVDRVLEVSSDSQSPNRVGRRCKAIKAFSYNEYFFPGHFPGKPMVPGVILLEAMAQVGALACYRPNDPQMQVVIVSSEAKFRKPVLPGDTCVLNAVITKDRGQMMVVETSTEVNGQLAAEATIMAHVTMKRQP
jgi:beta-hydroxyacyl-ACP dehydratase FabZ